MNGHGRSAHLGNVGRMEPSAMAQLTTCTPMAMAAPARYQLLVAEPSPAHWAAIMRFGLRLPGRDQR